VISEWIDEDIPHLHLPLETDGEPAHISTDGKIVEGDAETKEDSSTPTSPSSSERRQLGWLFTGHGVWDYHGGPRSFVMQVPTDGVEDLYDVPVNRQLRILRGRSIQGWAEGRELVVWLRPHTPMGVGRDDHYVYRVYKIVDEKRSCLSAIWHFVRDKVNLLSGRMGKKHDK
jgi:hypothetical protein